MPGPIRFSALFASRHGSRLAIVATIALLITASAYTALNVIASIKWRSQLTQSTTLAGGIHISVEGGAVTMSREGAQPVALVTRNCTPFVPILCPLKTHKTVEGAYQQWSLEEGTALPDDTPTPTEVRVALMEDGPYLEKTWWFRVSRVLNGTDGWGMIQFTIVWMMTIGLVQIGALTVLRKQFESAREPGRIDECLRTADAEGTPRMALVVWAAKSNREMRTSLEDEVNRLGNWFWLQRYLVWLVPSLGFFGTVIGMGAGLSLIDEVSLGNDTEKAGALFDLAGALGTAFDTTLVGLAAAIILKLSMERQFSEALGSLQRASELRRARLPAATPTEAQRLHLGPTFTIVPVEVPMASVILRGIAMGIIITVILLTMRSSLSL